MQNECMFDIIGNQFIINIEINVLTMVQSMKLFLLFYYYLIFLLVLEPSHGLLLLE